MNTSVQFTSLHSSWSQPTLPCAVSPSSVAEPARASESASRSVTKTDSPSKALALICMLYRSSVPADCCTSPGIDPPKAPKCSFAIPPGGTEKSRRGTSAEQERPDGGPGHQARRAGADGGRQELCGHDRPGQRVRRAGPGAARSRAPDEAARGPQRHCRGGPGHPDAEEGPGHEGGAQGRAVERPLRAGAGAYNARPHETVHGAPEDVEKQPATEFRVLQDNADKFQHNKDLADRRVKAVEDVGGRLPSADERGEELQPSVRRRAAAGGRGLHDRPQHGGAGDPAEAGAAGAAGQRRRGGPTDETQAGGREAAGRLPGASEAQTLD